MPQCTSNTKSGTRCKNTTNVGTKCTVHAGMAIQQNDGRVPVYGRKRGHLKVIGYVRIP